MADADNLKNEQFLNAAQHLRTSSSSISPRAPTSPSATAPKEIAAGNISNNSLRNIQKVAQQLVMNSPDRQRCLIRPHLRSSAQSPVEYESPDSCPPPPNNTPDSGPSNTTSNKGGNRSAHTPYSTVKGTPSGLAPPISSNRWTVTPVSLVGSAGSNLSTPGSAFSNKWQTPSSITSPVPSIVLTPPVEVFSPSNSYILSASETSFPSALSSIGTPRLRSDSEGSVSSILSLNSAMLKLIDSSQESISSSLEGFKGSDDQSDKSSDQESPISFTSKCSPKQTQKDDTGKKKAKDMRKKLLQDLMAAEVTRQEDEELKKHNIKLIDSYSPKGNEEHIKSQHVPIPGHPTSVPVSCKVITLILCLGMASFLVAYMFTDLLGPLQRRILVGDYDSLDAAKELIGSYNDGGVKSVLTKLNYDNNGNEDSPISTENTDIHEKMPGIHDPIFDNIEEADLNVLDVQGSDLHRLEEPMIHDLAFIFEDEIENESNGINESSDSNELDDGKNLDELSIENMKPIILKLLYHNILKFYENGDVNMKSYTNMYRYLNSFLTTFGSFAATQSKMLNDRIYTLEQLKEHNINYTYASTMFKFEFESGLIDDEFPISGSMIFTCLHRHLQYIQEALRNIIDILPRQSLYGAFRTAYDDRLADYHHWFVERFYLLGLSTLPTKVDALQKLNERFVETTSIAQLSSGLKFVCLQLKELTQVTEVLLNKNNVTQMIPAQVIT